MPVIDICHYPATICRRPSKSVRARTKTTEQRLICNALANLLVAQDCLRRRRFEKADEHLSAAICHAHGAQECVKTEIKYLASLT